MRRVLQLAVLLAALLLGLFLGTARTFDLSDRLTAGDLLDAFMTLLIAVLLGVLYNKTFSESRVEKDLIIAQSREVGAEMKTSRELFLAAFTGAPTEQLDGQILASTRSVSSMLSGLERACRECSYSNPLLDDAREHLRHYRKAVTDRCHAMNRRYTPEEYAEAESQYSRFQQALFLVSLRVNRS